MTSVAIVGSGLAMIACAKGLIKRGVKPVILDCGDTLDKPRMDAVTSLSKLQPEQWPTEVRDMITANPTLHQKRPYRSPQKLSFGSNYLYGESITDAPLNTDGETPPFSYAKGGFSVGWGAAVLPPTDSDLTNWPIKTAHLAPYFKQLLNDIPYSAVDDELSKHFPLYATNSKALELSGISAAILAAMKKSKKLTQSEVAFGQARLLTRAQNQGSDKGCQYCGYCMSGCVYDCIYKANFELDKLVAANKVEYNGGILVKQVLEQENSVRVNYINQTTRTAENLNFDRVFLAAGAVGSARIIMESKKLYDHPVELKSTGGFVVPMLRLKRASWQWPNTNTQPEIFFEFKDASNHWVHVQMGQPNEIVLEMLGLTPNRSGLLCALKRQAVRYLAVAHANMHSKHAFSYKLTLEKGADNGIDALNSKCVPNKQFSQTAKKSAYRLLSLGRHFGCYPLLPFITMSTKSYHVGGSLPMCDAPMQATETNTMGNPKGYSRVHVVDSSIFPCLPATTVGLLAMANSLRIASELEI